MKKDLQNSLRLYALTDLCYVNDEKSMADLVKEAIEQGATMIQLREKHLQGDALEQEAKEVLAVCKERNVPLIINDDLQLALKIHANGVHLGQKDGNAKEARKLSGEDFIIGVTAPSIELARMAQEDGADYIGAGAIYPTATKTDTKPLTPEALSEIVSSVSIPVVAIGGLNRHNCDLLMHTGITGIATSSGVFAHLDEDGEVEQFRKKAEEICASSHA